jgi:hypothetical protein
MVNAVLNAFDPNNNGLSPHMFLAPPKSSPVGRTRREQS